MTERLTKNELTWLLAQEARTAAEKLRRGVGMIAPEETLAAPVIIEEGSGGVESTLNRLDEAVSMLASLHGHPMQRGRRGKIDLAALLWEVAPEARVQIEMGEGTTVFGDESELRRMFHVLIGQSGDPRLSHAAPHVTIRREGDDIRIGVNLGPDTPIAFTQERSWLARMATRYGGRLELDGSMQTLVLAADVDPQRREVESLKKELAAAQAQGEAYARELAAVWSRGDTLPGGTTPLAPPVAQRPSRLPTSMGDGLAVLVAAVRALSGDLRGILAAVGRDIVPLRDKGGEVGDIAASVGRHVTGASEVVADLARLGSCPIGELPRPADVADLLRECVQVERARAQRHDVEIVLSSPESAEDTIEVGALTVLFQVLLDHAIEATPAGGKVHVELSETPVAYQVSFDDAGAPLPAAARASVLSRDFDAISLGRSQGLSLIAATTISAHLRLTLDVEEAPSGGTRVRVTLPRSA
ncbi:Sensory histidine kinase QseC [Minicystis rosea]|nr:Sensory histidine kinase QseC [Minicystis rosea]